MKGVFISVVLLRGRLHLPGWDITNSPWNRASVLKLTTKRPSSLMRMLVGNSEPASKKQPTGVCVIFFLWWQRNHTPVTHQTHYFIYPCHVTCLAGPAGTFWVDSRFFSNKNLHSEALSFQDVMQLPKHIGNFPAKPCFYMLLLTATLVGWGKSTQRSVLGFRQHGQLPGGSAEGRLLFSPGIQADS